MSPKPYVLGGRCRKDHLLTPANTYTEGTRLRCKDCRDVWKPAHPAEHLKNCPHGPDEHVQRKSGYWACKACAREQMRIRRPAKGIGAGGVNKAKTHCPYKHKYTPDNTAYSKDGKHRFCRTCARINGARQNLQRYGITLEQWETMLISQGGRCGICPDPLYKPHIDHDHACCPGQKSCGKCIRGLLCHTCNPGIGYLKDSIPVLQSAIQYLQGFIPGNLTRDNLWLSLLRPPSVLPPGILLHLLLGI